MKKPAAGCHHAHGAVEEPRAIDLETPLPQSSPYSLSGNIDYAAGAIVSKTLIDKQAGSVTLFAFAAGQGLSEHSAPYDALVQVVEGEGVFVVAGQAQRVAAGELFLMPANVPHAVKAGQAFKMLLVMIRSQ